MLAAAEPEMNDERYLWDGTGPVDPQVATLETTLAPLRYQRGPRRPRQYLAVAGALAGAIAATIAILVWTSVPAADSSWKLTRSDGSEQQLRVGQQVRTGGEEVSLRSAPTGFIQLEPNSELRVLSTGTETERVALEYGAMRAVIWAPPARFGVELPAATAVDLGCIYYLETSRDGDGRLRVEMGWVALQNGGAEAFIPAGASARIDSVRGPGIPVFDDAPEAFKTAVRSVEGDRALADLDALLRLARPRDALTLWHLLQRAQGPDRERVAGRFAALVRLPEGLDAATLAGGDPYSMDAAWNALQLGSTGWWRTWKRQWQPGRGL